jgi:ABC-type transport system involved in cytochrome c biogenesis permease component
MEILLIALAIFVGIPVLVIVAGFIAALTTDIPNDPDAP